MGLEEGRPAGRAIVVLQGGGRFEHVAEVLDVRLEPEPLTWEVAGPAEISIRGAIRAYVYCRPARARHVEGQGFHIPFSTWISTGEVPAECAGAALGEVSSDYSFDPVTGEFQHEITVEVVVRDRRLDPPGREAAVAAGKSGGLRASEDGALRGPGLALGSEPGQGAAEEKEATPKRASREDALAPQEDSRSREAPERRAPEPPAPEPPTPARPKRSSPIVWGPFPPPIGGPEPPARPGTNASVQDEGGRPPQAAGPS